MTTRVGLYRDKRNKGRPWAVRWFGEYDPTKGKQKHYSKAFAKKRDAETFQAAKQAELDRGGVRDRHQDITVEEIAKRFLEARMQNCRKGTKDNYRLTLDQLIQFMGKNILIQKITPELAERFVATRKRVSKTGSGYSPWSRNRHLGNAKSVFNVAVRWGHIATNPFSHIKKTHHAPRKWHHLKADEFQKLLDVVTDLRWRSFYYLAYTTGARFGELFNLTWADVDFEQGVVRIQDRPGSPDTPPFHVKDDESRFLLLPRQTIEALLAWQAEASEGVPYVLLTAERWQRARERWQLCRAHKPWITKNTGKVVWGEWENRYMVNNVIRDVRVHIKWAGIQTEAPLTVHTLRKSFGQNHANAGTPIHVLQGLMGHADITTTREFYLQRADANERDALTRYEDLLSNTSNATCVKLAYGPVSNDGQKKAASLNHSKETTWQIGASGFEPP